MFIFIALFRLQKYKKFESNSQRYSSRLNKPSRCFDCKSTKNLRAIHNASLNLPTIGDVVSTAKVQKIWEQFTTHCCRWCQNNLLFRLQKYKKFESNSQLILWKSTASARCFDCKSTKNLRAIHNHVRLRYPSGKLFRLQKYKKFESNSQLLRFS